jgi:probable F420-dependent oxidoreductase
MAQRLVSVWGNFFPSDRHGAEPLDAAAELDELGYHRLWFSAGFGSGVPARFAEILDATKRIGVAPGILSVWHATPAEAAEFTAAAERAHPGRFLLGLGASHAPIVEAGGVDYRKPYTKVVEYLDELDATDPLVRPEQRVLAALGPRMLKLSAERSLGAHPYFVPAEHTAEARAILGPKPLLAPEVAVVLDPNAETARAAARRYMARYLQLPNYSQNLRRIGYTDEDLLNGGSDRLVDVLIPWGDVDKVVAGLERHYAAGADEVTIQVLTDVPGYPADAFRQLAGALIG